MLRPRGSFLFESIYNKPPRHFFSVEKSGGKYKMFAGRYLEFSLACGLVVYCSVRKITVVSFSLTNFFVETDSEVFRMDVLDFGRNSRHRWERLYYSGTMRER